eukprot:Skav200009  [mRNA]  locus=scaffold1637:35036:35362:- [translate_table: standard]
MEEDGLSKVPGDLITMLMDAGDLDRLCATFKVENANVTDIHNRQSVVPMTEQQVLHMYGATEGKAVMESKVSHKLTTPDKNNPGKLCYLMFKEENEVDNIDRSSILIA